MGIPADPKEWTRDDMKKRVVSIVQEAQAKRLFKKPFGALTNDEKEFIIGLIEEVK